MSDDPYAREIGRLADSRDCEVIVGVSYDTVTLRTLGGAVELDTGQVEELAQLLIGATWQAAWQTAVSLARATAGLPPVPPPAAGTAP